MKRFLIKLLLFFSIIAILDIVFGRLCDYLQTHAKRGETKMMIDVCKNKDNDILIMGSSKAHHNYDSRQLSDSLQVKCYNVGQDGNGIILAYGMLSMMNKECLPKVIIYDVKQQFDLYKYSGDGDYTRYVKLLRPFWQDEGVKEIFGSISKCDLLKLHSSLYRNNGELINMVLNMLNSRNDDNMGYLPLFGELQDDKIQERDYENEIDTLKYSYLLKLVAFTEKNDIKLVFSLSPEYKTPLCEDFKVLRELCAKKGIPLFDHFNDLIFQNRSLFKDHCHLNPDGARVFTEQVVLDIRNNSLIN